jgi:hypothetical protein
VFVGYNEDSEAYKLYDPLSKKLLVSRDVIFYEADAWKWDNNDKNVEKIVHDKNVEKIVLEDNEADQHPGDGTAAAATSPCQSTPQPAIQSKEQEETVTSLSSSTPTLQTRNLAYLYEATNELVYDKKWIQVCCVYMQIMSP